MNDLNELGKPVSKLEQQRLEIAALKARVRDLEDDKIDLEERLALATVCDDENAVHARLVQWQAERRRLRQSAEEWQRQFQRADGRARGLARENARLKGERAAA